MKHRVKSISIHHFRGVESLTLDLAPPDGEVPDLVVFAGPNGSGKTSVLEACLLALGKEAVLGERGRARTNVQAGTDGFSVTVGLSLGESLFEVEARSDPSGAVRRTYGPQPIAPDWLVGAEKIGPPYRLIVEGIPVAYFSSWREPRLVGPVAITAGKKGKRPAATEDNRLWRLKNLLVNLRARKAFGAGESQPGAGPDQEQALLNTLNETWTSFYPGRGDRFDVFAASEQVEEGFDLFLLRGAGGQRIPVDSLSSGEIEVLTFLGTFLVEDLKDGLLFVDEPELHLHPGWHPVLLNALVKLLPETQIFVSTHSPHILNHVHPRRVRLLHQENGAIRAFQPEDAYGLDANRVLEELMGVPERPRRVADQIEKLFLLIDTGPIGEAKAALADLQRQLQSDPALAKAEMLLRRKEAIGK